MVCGQENTFFFHYIPTPQLTMVVSYVCEEVTWVVTYGVCEDAGGFIE